MDSATVDYVILGVFQVESSQPGMTFAPNLFRLDVSSDTKLPAVTVVPPSYTLEKDDRISEIDLRCRGAAVTPVRPPQPS
jgi:hypothetical protein